MTSTQGTIFDIKKFSVHDGPGIRTTVFFKGCPLSCWWCHNPESQSPQPEIQYFESRCILCGDCAAACENDAIRFVADKRLWEQSRCRLCGDCAAACSTEAVQLVGYTAELAEVMREIERDIPYYDQSGGGVTFSGGEPLQQWEFLAALLERCREHEIHTAVDTSGLAAWSHFERILPYTKLFLYDLKLMDAAKHRRYTGVSNELILENLHRLAKAGANLRVRIPLIPGINDDEANLAASLDFLVSLETVRQVDLLPYHNIASDKYRRMAHNYALAELETPSDSYMRQLAERFEARGFSVTIGG
jgi:pyruvate formate lyase activating enzyme